MNNLAKSMPQKGITQFELTSNLLRNLYKYDLTPVTKLVLLELTTHLNQNKNGSVVFPSVDFIAQVLGIGLTAAKKAINDLINEGLIIKSKRSKVRGNYNKYLLTPKVRNSASERAEIECFKRTESDRFHEEQITRINKPTDADYKILKDYALNHNAQNVPAYINWLKKTGNDKTIIKEYKHAKANNNAMLEAAKQTEKDLEYAKANVWDPPKEFFEDVRQRLIKGLG